MLVDISKCFNQIPKKYLKNHDYDNSSIPTQKQFTAKGEIPRDLAFCRWMACEKGVATMPGSLYYPNRSKHMSENFICLSISNDFKKTKQAIDRLKKAII